MIVFNTDLDNTLIYSYKHDIGSSKVNVEIYRDREISFMTDYSYDTLKKVNEEVLVVPTTTRTLEQYGRIDLGLGVLPYALVCNGGILLERGRENKEWYIESLRRAEPAKPELLKAISFLDTDSRRTFELRFIRELFVFTKCDDPENVICDLRRILDLNLVDVFCNGAKVYVVPRAIDKGCALERFRNYIREVYLKSSDNAVTVIAAGDSEFDVSMLKAADIAIAPAELKDKLDSFTDNKRPQWAVSPGELSNQEIIFINPAPQSTACASVFSDEVLRIVMDKVSGEISRFPL